jgi:hypothetical protein
LIGWSVISPEVKQTGLDIVDQKFNVPLKTGPGVSLLGDLVWDACLSLGVSGLKKNAVDQLICFSAALSSNEQYIDQEEIKKLKQAKEKEYQD